MVVISYKVIAYKDLIKWCLRHDDLRLQIENIISMHRNDEPFNVGYFIKENLENKLHIPFMAYLMVLIEDNKVVGVSRLEIDKRNVGYISAVYILSSHRGQGLCSKMLAEFVHYVSKKNKHLKFELAVLVDNSSAIRCYEKAGFVIVETKEVDGEMEHTMIYKPQ